MIRIILATHAGLGKAMLDTAAIISGGTEGVQTIELHPGDATEDVEYALRDLISIAGKEDILCLVDIPGGSPARVAASLAIEAPNFHVVSGLNLGMLTETLLLRNSVGIAGLKEHIMKSAVSTITDVGEKFIIALAEEQKER